MVTLAFGSVFAVVALNRALRNGRVPLLGAAIAAFGLTMVPIVVGGLAVGGFFDAHSADWDAAQLDWFEALLEEQDVDIMGWAIGSIACPAQWGGPMMERMRSLTYVPVSR